MRHSGRGTPCPDTFRYSEEEKSTGSMAAGILDIVCRKFQAEGPNSTCWLIKRLIPAFDSPTNLGGLNGAPFPPGPVEQVIACYNVHQRIVKKHIVSP